jgi:2-keto-4-pentenoate hydratase/2-oxohepta-3-ene-1,7-dioic acid hydratase in catechol pathway
MRVVRSAGRAGVLRGNAFVDATPLLSGIGDPTVELVGSWAQLGGRLDELPDEPLAGLEAPIVRPGKIIAAPANYGDHVREMEITVTVADLGLFLKAPTSITGPGGPVELPYTDRRTDQEAELALVVGRRARHVPPDRALDHVFGYTCLLDITVRGSEDRSTRKSFDTFTPIGPWIVTADEIPDPDRLTIRCWVNDVLRQDANTADLIFGVRELVAYASSVMTLEPGDLIATGTPAGVGPLAHGDLVAVEIEQVGRLEVTVTAAHAAPWENARPSPAID